MAVTTDNAQQWSASPQVRNEKAKEGGGESKAEEAKKAKREVEALRSQIDEFEGEACYLFEKRNPRQVERQMICFIETRLWNPKHGY
uniref:Uncharacterized protein n=1 Tax=Cannabis sativa TaxID=3483 RepID=A0A803PR96_CANSA